HTRHPDTNPARQALTGKPNPWLRSRPAGACARWPVHRPARRQAGACGAAGPASASASGLGRPRPSHAGPDLAENADQMAHRTRRPVQCTTVFLVPDCPARGHRVKGGPAGRRMRSAAPTIDPVTTHKDPAPTRKTGQNRGLGSWEFDHPRKVSPSSVYQLTSYDGRIMDRERLIAELASKGLQTEEGRLHVIETLGRGGNGVAFLCSGETLG